MTTNSIAVSAHCERHKAELEVRIISRVNGRWFFTVEECPQCKPVEFKAPSKKGKA